MIRDGQKWACNSCIRGHRVSACNHTEREVFLIAKKGRPVKQCEHCRSARKDKSHHAKCDCGSKKHKEATAKSEPKQENVGCCCRDGTKCTCGIKSDEGDLRLHTSLSRPTHAVKSKPSLSTSASESKLTVFANGHHKLHRNNNLAHTSGQPYKIPPRPHSLHGHSSFLQGTSDGDSLSRSADDLQLLNNDAGNYGVNYAAQLSADSLQASPFTSNLNADLAGYDFQSLLSHSPELGDESDGSQLIRTTSADTLSTSMGWYDPSLSTVAEAPGDFSASPSVMFDFNEADWSIPSATTDSFSPSDLPLVTSQPPEFSQPISHSGESNYQSAPALTASSSGAQSEIGEFNYPSDGDNNGQDGIPTYWSHTVPFRETTPIVSARDFSFPQSLPMYDGLPRKRRSTKPRHRQTYSAGSNTYNHIHNLSGSTDSGKTEVNIGHMQNLATLAKAREAAMTSSQSSPLYPPAGEEELRAITIPAGTEDSSITDDWYFAIPEDAQRSTQAADFAWLS